MNTLVILYFWGVSACGSTAHWGCSKEIYEWKYMGQFESLKDCEQAVKELALPPNKARCISTGTASAYKGRPR